MHRKKTPQAVGFSPGDIREPLLCCCSGLRLQGWAGTGLVPPRLAVLCAGIPALPQQGARRGAVALSKNHSGHSA